MCELYLPSKLRPDFLNEVKNKYDLGQLVKKKKKAINVKQKTDGNKTKVTKRNIQ